MTIPGLVTRWDIHFKTYFYLMVFIWALVTLILVYFGFKYRRRTADGEGRGGAGNLFLEILWTLIPLLIVLFLGIQTWALFRDFRRVPQDAYEIRVEGYMWGWNMTYPNGQRTRNEMRIPAGRPVRVYLTSQDVLHALYIPAFRIQEEAIPGRTTYLWFQANEPGEYDIFCTEFCGSGHSLMRGKIIAMEPAAFEQWSGKQAQPAEGPTGAPPHEKGKQLVSDSGCLNCHTLTGEKGIGPSFKNLMGKKESLEDGTTILVDDAYVKESILAPKTRVVKGYPPAMPSYQFSDQEIHAITEYFETLK